MAHSCDPIHPKTSVGQVCGANVKYTMTPGVFAGVIVYLIECCHSPYLTGENRAGRAVGRPRRLSPVSNFRFMFNPLSPWGVEWGCKLFWPIHALTCESIRPRPSAAVNSKFTPKMPRGLGRRGWRAPRGKLTIIFGSGIILPPLLQLV